MTSQMLGDRTHSLADSYRGAMRQLAGTVSVIAAGGEGDRSGITVTSVTSLSTEPPSLLVCVNQKTSLLPILKRYLSFSVNILAADQQRLADRFAGRNGEKGEERFIGSRWGTHVTGAPVLVDALVSLDCEIESVIDHKSHVIVIGAVRAVSLNRDVDVLVYRRGGYGRIAP